MSNLNVMQNLSRRLDSASNDDETQKVLEDILDFTKVLCKKKKLHNSILTAMKNPTSGADNEENEFECFNKLQTKISHEIVENDSKSISRSCLQIFFNILWCHSKWCEVPLIYDKLFMRSYDILAESVLLRGPKNVTGLFVKNLNQRLDYLTSFYHLASSSNFLPKVISTSQNDFSNYVKTLLKLDPPKTEDDFNTVFQTEKCASKDCLKFLTFDFLKTKFTKTWLSVLSIPMEVSVETSVLFHLSSNLIPLFSDPRDLTDFLFAKLESSSLKSRYLSLDCLQTLVGRYNLEYPDLYEKLYDMCTEEAFTLNICSDKFLQVLRKFLLSSKLSNELLVKFCRRLADRVLKSEATTALKLLALLDEVLKTHKLVPTRQTNLKRKASQSGKMNPEMDPQINQAVYVSEDLMVSILQMKEAMKTHYHPEVRNQASKVAEISAKVKLGDNLEFEDLSTTMFKLAHKKVPKEEINFVVKTEFLPA